ncbi:heavy metal-associated isoprenylated plant protein 19 [Vigna radiata var. radiata]|uniref:Heavy metal-associated isoprenylated plant protein 19 n=1 Tax=Vigna radiata var. radiata TaxID=3916 RepID=A0A1S3ULB2_VIGRR|nr:heavy metal-associated isoprenylated plant protein 19 [Vigna radiata var. radiata]
MDKNKKFEQKKLITVEYKVSMYCNECERIVAKTLIKCKGVEKFITDMKKNLVVVTGWIDPMKVKKKLKKKTGKRVEIVRNEDEEVAKDDSHESDKLVVMYQFAVENDCCIETEATMILSDENPHACALM